MNNIEPAPVPEAVAALLEKSDWTPKEALQFYAAGQHFEDGYSPADAYLDAP